MPPFLIATGRRSHCRPATRHGKPSSLPATIKRSGRGGDDDTIDGSESNQQSTNDGKWRGGGATGRRHDEGRGHAHNNQIDHAEGGVVGDDGSNDDDAADDNDDDGHDNDDDDDNGGCGGRDGHHRMRKGRGHDNRTNTTIK